MELWFKPRWALTSKVFLGDKKTNAQKREFLTDDLGISLGLKFKLIPF